MSGVDTAYATGVVDRDRGQVNSRVRNTAPVRSATTLKSPNWRRMLSFWTKRSMGYLGRVGRRTGHATTRARGFAADLLQMQLNEIFHTIFDGIDLAKASDQGARGVVSEAFGDLLAEVRACAVCAPHL